MTKRRQRPTAQFERPAPRRRITPWLLLVIAAAAATPYARALEAPFVFDDFATVVENPRIAEWTSPAALSPPADTPVAGRPLVHFSLALNRAWGGLEPYGYRLFNLAVHVACACLVFLFLRRSLRDALAFAAALIWAVHPINSEPVMYVTQRTESLMAFFYLLTVFASAQAHHRRGRLWPIIAVMAGLAGAASKETIATVPLMVALYDRAFVYASFADAVRARWRLYAGLALIWALLGVLLLTGGQTIAAGFSGVQASPWNYLLNQSIMVVRYLRLAVWPDALVVYYGWPRLLTAADVWPYAMVVFALLAASVALLWRRPRVGYWAAWFFVTLAPTTSILPIATEVGAERRMYLPMVGIVALAAVGASAALESLRRRGWRVPSFAVAMTMVVISAAAIGVTAARTREYASPLLLANTVLDRWPSPNAHQMVGTELAKLGRHQEAVPHLRDALNGYKPARYFLGSSLLKLGRLDEGVVELRQFILEQPDALAARGAHGMVANALAEQQRFGEAVPHYREYLKAQPADADAWNGLGVALAITGANPDAVRAFESAVNVAPNRAELHLNLAQALQAAGRFDEARAAADRAAALDPSIRR